MTEDLAGVFLAKPLVLTVDKRTVESLGDHSNIQLPEVHIGLLTASQLGESLAAILIHRRKGHSGLTC